MSITNSTFSHECFKFGRNQGLALFLNSPFTVIKNLEVFGNRLIQNHTLATFTLQESTVNWTGTIQFAANKAEYRGLAGLQSINQTIHVVGNLSLVNNSASYGTGFIYAWFISAARW